MLITLPDKALFELYPRAEGFLHAHTHTRLHARFLTSQHIWRVDAQKTTRRGRRRGKAEKRKKPGFYAEVLIHVGQRRRRRCWKALWRTTNSLRPLRHVARVCSSLTLSPCSSFSLFFSELPLSVSFPLTRNFRFALLHSTCDRISDGKTASDGPKQTRPQLLAVDCLPSLSSASPSSPGSQHLNQVLSDCGP